MVVSGSVVEGEWLYELMAEVGVWGLRAMAVLERGRAIASAGLNEAGLTADLRAGRNGDMVSGEWRVIGTICTGKRCRASSHVQLLVTALCPGQPPSSLPNAWAKRLANDVSIHSSLHAHTIHPFETIGDATDSMPNVYPATGLFPS